MLSFRQAFILSLTIHLVLLPGMGWLAGGWLKTESVSQVIELELAAGGSVLGYGTAAAAEPTDQAQPHNSPVITPVAPPDPEPAMQDAIGPVMPNTVESQSVATGTVAGSVPGHASGLNQSNGSGNARVGSGSGTGTAPDGAGGSARTPSVILPPRVLDRQEPEYPIEARRANQEGVVGLRIEILENGSPGSIRVARSSGYPALDAAAETAVRNWRFVPARDSLSGVSVASVTVLSVAFRLR